MQTELPTSRVKDGKCDPAGRFLAGTMDMNEKDPNGALYSFDGQQITTLLSGVTISNGLAWSPDHKTFYYIDTPTRQVKAFDYDLAAGQIANPRTVIHVPESIGWPDGMTSDTDGNLWIAMWGGAQMTKWNPNTGKLLEQIPVPALNTSACVFGGKDMNELYITSARKGMSDADLKNTRSLAGYSRWKQKSQGCPRLNLDNMCRGAVTAFLRFIPKISLSIPPHLFVVFQTTPQTGNFRKLCHGFPQPARAHLR
jgi:sugar lactone lactonase YvrE